MRIRINTNGQIINLMEKYKEMQTARSIFSSSNTRNNLSHNELSSFRHIHYLSLTIWHAMYKYFLLTELNDPTINATCRARSKHVNEDLPVILVTFCDSTYIPISPPVAFPVRRDCRNVFLFRDPISGCPGTPLFTLSSRGCAEWTRWRASDNIMVSSRHPSHVTRCFQVRRCAAFCSTTRPDCALKDLSGIRFQLLSIARIYIPSPWLSRTDLLALLTHLGTFRAMLPNCFLRMLIEMLSQMMKKDVEKAMNDVTIERGILSISVSVREHCLTDMIYRFTRTSGIESAQNFTFYRAFNVLIFHRV